MSSSSEDVMLIDFNWKKSIFGALEENEVEEEQERKEEEKQEEEEE